MTVATSHFAERSRRAARRKEWAPPLAWDDIDDPDEEPRGHLPTATLPTTAHRAEHLAELVERGAGISVACRELEVGREALEKWCQRHGLNDTYATLTGREFIQQQYRNGATGAA